MTTTHIPEDISFKEAMQHVRGLISDIDRLDDDLDLLMSKVKDAKNYLAICHDKIYDAEAQLNDIFGEEE